MEYVPWTKADERGSGATATGSSSWSNHHGSELDYVGSAESQAGRKHAKPRWVRGSELRRDETNDTKPT